MIRFVLISLFLVVSSTAFCADTIEKIYCTNSVNKNNVDALKATLLSQAKVLLANEIFGELIYSSTIIENSILKSDLVSSVTSGLIRIDGTPIFYNGSGFSEACVKVFGYITKEDIEKSKPIKLTRKQCFTNQALTAKDLKVETKRQALLNSLYEYDPDLKNKNVDRLLKLPSKIDYTESGFIPDTETYCTRFSGEVIPIGISAFLLDIGKNHTQKTILGTWFGPVTQEGQKPFNVEMEIEKLDLGEYSGKVNYSGSSSCSGLSIFENKKSGYYIFREIISYQISKCLTMGRIEVTLEKNNLKWKWYRKGSNLKPLAQAVLSRR